MIFFRYRITLYDPLYYAPRRVREAEDAPDDALRRMPRAANLDVRPRAEAGAGERSASCRAARLASGDAGVAARLDMIRRPSTRVPM